MKKSRYLWLGLALLALAALWHFGFSVQWRQRFFPTWREEYNFVGISTLPDYVTDQFPTSDTTGIYQRIFAVVAHDGKRATLQDHYLIHDPLTDEIIYNYTYSATVDAMTGAYVDGPYQGDYYLFPREVEQTTYRIRNNYFKGIPVAFQRVEVIEGIRTYLFSYHGPAEYTESYANQQDALGRKVEAGQEIRCADDQFHLNMWVEPFTGTVLKFDESCYAGDYVFDIASGERLFPVLRWGAVTAGDDVQARSDTLRIRLIHYHAATRYFPMFLLGSGLFFLALSLIPIFFKNFITHRAAQESAQKTRREAARYA